MHSDLRFAENKYKAVPFGFKKKEINHPSIVWENPDWLEAVVDFKFDVGQHYFSQYTVSTLTGVYPNTKFFPMTLIKIAYFTTFKILVTKNLWMCDIL